MAGEPSWFEIGVQDTERGRAFYGKLLGWELTPFGGGFVIGTPGAGGGMHGGDPGATAMAFFAVDDLDTALETVAALGGERVMIHERARATLRATPPSAASPSARTTRDRPSGSTSADPVGVRSGAQIAPQVVV